MQQTGGRGTARVRLLGDGAAAPGSRTAATSKQPAGGSNRSLASDMVRSVAPASHLAKTSAPPPATSKVTAKKKTDEIFKRMLPHTIVQTYEKLQLALQLDAQLVVNGETLTPTPFSTPTRASIDDKRPARPSASGAFDPTQGRFHYALSTQFAPAALSLSAIQDVFVVISSRVCSTQMHPLPSSTSNTKSAKTRSSSAPAVTRQSWRLIASADPKLGLALYELPIGKWQTGSAVVALVWSASSTLEVARLYLQLHIPELIYSTLERPLKVPQDEGDNNSKHGLQGFTMALTLRSLDRVVWEQEWYQIDFPSPQRGDASVTVQLLDEERTSRDRGRFTNGTPAVTVKTEALNVAIDAAVLMDFCVWDESASVPVWGVSRIVAVSEGGKANGGDFGLGAGHRPIEVRFQDAARNSALAVRLVRLRDGERTLVQQVEVALSVAFINGTFGTKY